MAIGKNRLAARLSQVIHGALNSAAEGQADIVNIQEDTPCTHALRNFAEQHPSRNHQPVPDWRLLSPLP